MINSDDSTCNGAVPHPYAPILGSYGIANDVKLWACDSPDKNKGIRSEPSYIGHTYIPRLCRVNKQIEEETRYQGRGIDTEYKLVRSEHCDMDRLPAYLKIQRVSTYYNILIISYTGVLLADPTVIYKKISFRQRIRQSGYDNICYAIFYFYNFNNITIFSVIKIKSTNIT